MLLIETFRVGSIQQQSFEAFSCGSNNTGLLLFTRERLNTHSFTIIAADVQSSPRQRKSLARTRQSSRRHQAQLAPQPTDSRNGRLTEIVLAHDKTLHFALWAASHSACLNVTTLVTLMCSHTTRSHMAGMALRQQPRIRSLMCDTLHSRFNFLYTHRGVLRRPVAKQPQRANDIPQSRPSPCIIDT